MGLLGIGDGKMEITIKSSNVSLGGTLEGTATLTLKKEITAKGVVAILTADQTSRKVDVNGRMNNQTELLYHNKQQLDTAKTYPKDTPIIYNFKLAIPQSAINPIPGVGGILKDLVTESVRLGGPVHWFMEVKLEIGMLESVSRIQEVIVNPASAPTGGINL